MKGPQDRYRRTIDYMRISVTDRCNLRCVYCMPAHGVELLAHREILRYEEIVRVVKVASGMGLKRIRITGGEPLVRKDLCSLVESLYAIDGIEDLSLTTNGTLLEKHAAPLAAAGLKRLNISLDSLRSDRYREITRGGDLKAVLRGIDAAVEAGLSPVKINVVPIRGLNDDEIPDFVQMALRRPYQVRFIELMPFGAQPEWSEGKFVSSAETREAVEKIVRLKAVKKKKAGPARYFSFEGAAGVIGFISPLSSHFCGECNRLRLTADGRLMPCLFSETRIDLKPAVRGHADDKEIERLISLGVLAKPRGHGIESRETWMKGFHKRRPMSKIGG